ncbi:MAG TPA: response regulator [Kofleriaceae bacterium]|jgi:CheY-like chemotaxis protein
MTQSVLIVDDEFGLADITAELLREAGYEVRLAINGQLGLDSLAAHPADLVLTDLMMPVMDGPEMIRQMRADPRFAAIPTILMTALPEAVPNDAAQYDVLLIKPFSLVEILDLVRRLLPPDGRR